MKRNTTVYSTSFSFVYHLKKTKKHWYLCQDTVTSIIGLSLVESFPRPQPQGHGSSSDTISLLSAPCVTVTGFTGMPVPVAEHFWYLVYFKQTCIHMSTNWTSEEWKAWETLFYFQGDISLFPFTVSIEKGSICLHFLRDSDILLLAFKK